MKLAFVVQRYGAGIAGGSEMHCRQLAERLASRHDITVLTTCARDYVTWENAYPAGLSVENGIRLQRFPVARTRDLKAFADLSDEVFDGLGVVARTRGGMVPRERSRRARAARSPAHPRRG